MRIGKLCNKKFNSLPGSIKTAAVLVILMFFTLLTIIMAQKRQIIVQQAQTIGDVPNTATGGAAPVYGCLGSCPHDKLLPRLEKQINNLNQQAQPANQAAAKKTPPGQINSTFQKLINFFKSMLKTGLGINLGNNQNNNGGQNAAPVVGQNPGGNVPGNGHLPGNGNLQGNPDNQNGNGGQNDNQDGNGGQQNATGAAGLDQGGDQQNGTGAAQKQPGNGNVPGHDNLQGNGNFQPDNAGTQAANPAPAANGNILDQLMNFFKQLFGLGGNSASPSGTLN